MRNELPETCFAMLPGMGDLMLAAAKAALAERPAAQHRQKDKGAR